MSNSLEAICAELGALPRKRDGEVYLTDLENIAERIGADNALARVLWNEGSLPARLLAIRLAVPEEADDAMLEHWVSTIDHIRICDSFASLVVAPNPLAVQKITLWAGREAEFERCAAFIAMARLALLENEYGDEVFTGFLPLIAQAAYDERTNVKRAVNGALYEIGRRNQVLLQAVLILAAELQASDNETARWVGTHNIGELS